MFVSHVAAKSVANPLYALQPNTVVHFVGFFSLEKVAVGLRWLTYIIFHMK